ncbi:hypothetical protein DXG01_008537 [Tephrocybe rancida]|nr:hypothetical protein DXG01_008537 [Tephrocybe rancida]
MCFGLATMSEAFKLVVIETFVSVTWVDVIWLAFSAACDLVIAIVQVVHLHRHRSGLPGTNRLVNILTTYILSTGLLTSIVAIIQLTTFAAMGFNFTLVFLSIFMGALYGVSLLAKIVRRGNTEPGTLGLDNLRSTRNPDTTLNLAFNNSNLTKSEGPVDTFQSNTTKFSDLHVHPEVEDTKKQDRSTESVFESV